MLVTRTSCSTRYEEKEFLNYTNLRNAFLYKKKKDTPNLLFLSGTKLGISSQTTKH